MRLANTCGTYRARECSARPSGRMAGSWTFKASLPAQTSKFNKSVMMSK